MNIASFDNIITGNSVLTHYFYEQKWNNGELTEQDMQTYAKEYYHLVKAMPELVKVLLSKATECEEGLRKAIEHNLSDENNHIEMWERFASSFGVSKAELLAYQPSQGMQDAVAELFILAEKSLHDAVAVMYALELDLPQIAKTKKDGLCKFYNKPESNEDAHIYFDEHLKEEKHINVWKSFNISPERVHSTVLKTLATQHKVLDAICDEAGIECPCE